MSSGNLALWEEVCNTPPNVTKPFKRAGGFQGTSVDPMYLIRRLTELFGPVGIGWNLEVITHWSEEVNGVKHAYVKASLRYRLSKDSEDWHTTPACIGGTDCTRSADEAYKASMTDALSNCCKYLGFAEDIYTGKHDGDKYQSAPAVAPSAPKRIQVPPKPENPNRVVNEIAERFENGGNDGFDPSMFDDELPPDAEPEPVAAGNWRDVVVHFGLSAGKRLGDLDDKGRKYFAFIHTKKAMERAEKYPLTGQDKTLYDACVAMREEMQ